MNNHKKYLRNRHERGQGLIEYALILSLVALLSIGVLTLLGFRTRDAFGEIVCAFRNQEDCDLGPERECPNEQLVTSGHPSGFGAFGCLTDDWFLLSVASSCPGAQLSLDGYGGLSYDTTYGLHVISVNPTTSGECVGRSASGLPPIGSYTVSSLHPDGNYETHTLP